MDFLSSLLGSILNFGATLYGQEQSLLQQSSQQVYNSLEAEKARLFQKSEREASQEFNVDMWNMAFDRVTDYYSPANELQRYKDAGLTANAMLKGSTTPYMPSSPVSNPLPGFMASAPSGALSSSLMSSYSNLGRNTADIINTLAQARATDYQTEYNKKTEPQRVAQLNSNLKKDWAQIQLWLSEKGVNDLTYNQLEETNKYIGQFKTAEIKKILAEINLAENEAIVKEKEASLLEEKTLTEGAQRDLIGSQQNLLDEQQKHEAEQVKLLKQKAAFCDKWGLPLEAPESAVLWEMKQRNCLDEYIENTITKPERAKWKPQDHYVEDEDTTTFFGYSFGKKRKAKEKKKSSSPNSKTPTMNDLNFTD